jgi:hypothetical protein
MSTKDQAQPLGPLVGAHPVRRPERTMLRGRMITLVPLNADAHADALFRRVSGGGLIATAPHERRIVGADLEAI